MSGCRRESTPNRLPGPASTPYTVGTRALTGSRRLVASNSHLVWPHLAVYARPDQFLRASDAWATRSEGGDS